MLAPAMRMFITVTGLIVIVGVIASTWTMTRGPSAAQAARIAAVLESTVPADEPAAYAHCASCHLHDGTGRPDGSIPRLNGQRRAVLENKLYRLRAGLMRMPVMDPYARTLAPKDITDIATYLSELPATMIMQGQVTEEEQAPEIPPARLLPVGHTPAATAIALDAAKSPLFSEERQWLVKRLRSELGRDDIRRVEVRILEWDLERSKVELIDPRKPDRESVVGSFEVAEMRR